MEFRLRSGQLYKTWQAPEFDMLSLFPEEYEPEYVGDEGLDPWEASSSEGADLEEEVSEAAGPEAAAALGSGAKAEAGGAEELRAAQLKRELAWGPK